ncbi:hypothetical protein G6F64_013638 [Rhizopus arrhizus]|uniref:Uncharacterized protein n=1 Tax=Rhizopus oryzae TaxID=64495 RepID=A0A9P7BKK2_RHIOR|nr:hypothetical protein G6F64_013638 [Rhizopus arrhizus]
MGLQKLAKLVPPVMPATIGMEDQARSLWMQSPGIGKCFHYQFFSQALGNAVAQHLPGLDADDHGQMQPSLAGGDIRDIPDPRRRSGSGGKLPIQQVGGELR